MSMRMPAPARLDPVGRLRPPRRGMLLRLAAVAVLLLTAAGVLYAAGTQDRGSDPGLTGERTQPGIASPSAGPSSAPSHAASPVPVPAADRLPVPEGMVGVPVSLDDPASLAVLRPGDRVDLLAVPAAGVSATGAEPVPMAGDRPVLAVDRSEAVLLLALTPDQGRAVIAAPADTTFAVVLRAED